MNRSISFILILILSCSLHAGSKWSAVGTKSINYTKNGKLNNKRRISIEQKGKEYIIEIDKAQLKLNQEECLAFKKECERHCTDYKKSKTVSLRVKRIRQGLTISAKYWQAFQTNSIAIRLKNREGQKVTIYFQDKHIKRLSNLVKKIK